MLTLSLSLQRLVWKHFAFCLNQHWSKICCNSAASQAAESKWVSVRNLGSVAEAGRSSYYGSKTICKPGWAPYWGGWGFYNSFFRKGHLRRLEEDEDRVLGSNLSESADSMFQVPSLSSLCPLPVSVTQNLRQVGYHWDGGTKGPTPTRGVRVHMFKQDFSMTHDYYEII